MFKKVEIWILYLIIFLFLPLSACFGFLIRQELVGSRKFGSLSKSALFVAELPVNFLRFVEGVNYDLRVANRFSNLNGFDGIPNEKESFLLLSRHNKKLNEGIVELIDLTNFKVLHTWNPDLNSLNKLVEQVDEFKYLERDKNNSRSLISHPLLLKDGGLVFQDVTPLRKIDSCSNLIFQNTKDLFHHSNEVDIDGNIWTSTHIYPQTLPVNKVGRNNIHDKGGYFDDGIVKLSKNGKILFEKSISQIFIENGLEYLLFAAGPKSFHTDPLHVNDIQPVNFNSKYWKKGDVFMSLRRQSMILLYRPSTNKIIWKGTGPFFQNHDVDILDESRIAIFNNNSKDLIIGSVVDGHNEVNIYDFKTKEYSSYLKDSLIKNDVRTITGGRSEILPNGDLYIEESDYARILYFNSDGSLRWTHVNRFEDGNIYRTGWSRILYGKDDILNVRNFLNSRSRCVL